MLSVREMFGLYRGNSFEINMLVFEYQRIGLTIAVYRASYSLFMDRR